MPREQACLAANIAVFISLLFLLLTVYIPSKQRVHEAIGITARSQLQAILQETILLSNSKQLLSESRYNILKWKFEDLLQRYAQYGFVKHPEFRQRVKQQQKMMADIEENVLNRPPE